MRWSQIRSTLAVALMVLLVAVGFTAVPAAAVDGTDATRTENGDGDEFPEVVCTDITGAVGDELPYDRVIWVDDLPEELQPENVPWNLVTPRSVASIVLGVSPNQCDVFDPNDPPYDPREDDVDPDGDADVVEGTEDGTTLIVVNGTLNRSADGPGGEIVVEFAPESDGEVDPELRINDGEKDYALDPGVRYWGDGTVYVENDVVVLGKRAGVEFDCNGDECEVDLRGAPRLVDYPTVPSHTDEDHLSDSQGNDDVNDGDGDVSDGSEDPDSTDGSDTDNAETPTDDTGGDDTAGDGSDAGTDADAGDRTDADVGDGDEVDDADDGSADGDDGTEETDDGSESDSAGQPAQAGAQGDGPGFGAGLAALSVLIATLMARRRYS